MDNSVDEVDISAYKVPERSVLAIFAKQPVPGRVKTRLCPPLDAAEAANFYEQSLKEIVSRIKCGLPKGCDLKICYSGDRKWFDKHFPGIGLVEQRGADLGARMEQVLNGFFSAGYRRAILIGSDTPDLPLSVLHEALDLLRDVEVVYGPAADGGYYLIGESRHYPELFKNIPWSTGQVLVKSLDRAAAIGIFTARLPVYEDLDDFAALRKFIVRSPGSSTASYLVRELPHHFNQDDSGD